MKYVRKWTQEFAQQRQLAKVCQYLTDKQWTVHSVIYTPSVIHDDVTAVGACIVAWKDEPDLTGGVPR